MARSLPSRADIALVQASQDISCLPLYDHSYGWYIVRTETQKEYIACQIVRQRGWSAFVPSRHVYRRKTRYYKPKVARVYALLAGHMLVALKKPEQFYGILNLDCIKSILCIANVPIALTAEGVQWFAEMYRLNAPRAHAFMRTHHEFSAGDDVTIVDHPFAGLAGKVENIDEKHGTARILFEIFGSERDADISLDNLIAAA